MLELVLRLTSLLCLLLLLDQSIGIFRLVGAGVARLRLRPLVLRRMPVLLGAGGVLSVLGGLEVLPLRLSPLRVLVLQLAALMLVLLLHVGVVRAVLAIGADLLDALAARGRHSRWQALARRRWLPRLALVLVQGSERLHCVWALARVVKGVVADAKGLLPTRSKLRLLMQSSNMHRQGLALWPHQLVVPCVLIGRQLVAEQLHVILIGNPVSVLRGHQPHLMLVVPLRLRLGLEPVLLWRLACCLLLRESTAVLFSELVFEFDVFLVAI